MWPSTFRIAMWAPGKGLIAYSFSKRRVRTLGIPSLIAIRVLQFQWDGLCTLNLKSNPTLSIRVGCTFGAYSSVIQGKGHSIFLYKSVPLETELYSIIISHTAQECTLPSAIAVQCPTGSKAGRHRPAAWEAYCRKKGLGSKA